MKHIIDLVRTQVPDIENPEVRPHAEGLQDAGHPSALGGSTPTRTLHSDEAGS